MIFVRKFLYIEEKETRELASNGMMDEQTSKKVSKLKKGNFKTKKEKAIEEIISEVRKSSDGQSDSEEDFWIPPVGDRRDLDDRGDRWCSFSESEQDNDKVYGIETGETFIYEFAFYIFFSFTSS